MCFHNFFFLNLKLFSSGLFLLAATCDQHCYHCKKYVLQSFFYGRLGASQWNTLRNKHTQSLPLQREEMAMHGPGLLKKREKGIMSGREKIVPEGKNHINLQWDLFSPGHFKCLAHSRHLTQV